MDDPLSKHFYVIALACVRKNRTATLLSEVVMHLLTIEGTNKNLIRCFRSSANLILVNRFTVVPLSKLMTADQSAFLSRH